jgi:hypothetical protein
MPLANNVVGGLALQECASMSAQAYDDILSRAQRELSAEELLKLANALCQHAGAKGRQHSILELRGLGKEIWEGIDPDEYVRKERDSWDG